MIAGAIRMCACLHRSGSIDLIAKSSYGLRCYSCTNPYDTIPWTVTANGIVIERGCENVLICLKGK